MKDVLCYVLAGGEGSRLRPLTTGVRAKPAVYFAGGNRRLIDFPLSNSVNSGVNKIAVLTMHESTSLLRHLDRAWKPKFHTMMEGAFLVSLFPTYRTSKEFVGSADAIYQHLDQLDSGNPVPTQALILGGDHIYKMNYCEYRKQHEDTKAALTVAGIPVSFNDQANYDVKPDGSKRFKFGIFGVDENWKITSFREKPEECSPIFKDLELKDRPGQVLASMGIYFFTKEAMVGVLNDDAKDIESKHDLGGNIVPKMISKSFPVFAYDFSKNSRAGNPAYWEDVGDPDKYFKCHLDLVRSEPLFDLGNLEWRIHGFDGNLPPARITSNGHPGVVLDSLLCEGSWIRGSKVRSSVIGPDVYIGPYIKDEIKDLAFFNIDECVIFLHAKIGPNVKLHRTIVEKGVEIPEGIEIGYDKEKDSSLVGFHEKTGKEMKLTISSGGVRVIPRHFTFKK